MAIFFLSSSFGRAEDAKLLKLEDVSEILVFKSKDDLRVNENSFRLNRNVFRKVCRIVNEAKFKEVPFSEIWDEGLTRHVKISAKGGEFYLKIVSSSPESFVRMLKVNRLGEVEEQGARKLFVSNELHSIILAKPQSQQDAPFIENSDSKGEGEK